MKILRITLILFFVMLSQVYAQVLNESSFRTPRNLPFRNLAVTQTITVSQFKDGGEPLSVTVQKALNALAGMEGNAELIFDEARYELDDNTSSNVFFTISNTSNKVINGNNAEII